MAYTLAMAGPRIVIIGTGFSGLCLGIQLKRAGFEDFTILEKADHLGGTWRENTYPGAACDLMSFAYCFSFEQKTDWTRKWSPQPEILAYMEHCAQKYGLLPHIRFGAEVVGARFEEERGVWRVRTREGGVEGDEFEAEVLVSGVGQLHKPVYPDLPGRESFAGPSFHSAAWDASVPLEGKRIGVIGSAASAIQFIPEIAKQASQLTVFQRTPNWIIPRGDRAYTENEKRWLGRSRLLAKAYRSFIWARQELMFPLIVGKMQKRWREMALGNLEEHIQDPELRKKLTPNYPVGGKRVLIHDDYFPALARENVELVTEAIERIDASGVVTADGEHHAFDVLVYGTGFDTTHFMAPMEIEGRDGHVLESQWKDGAEAYLGLTVAGFPNFFMMYGPNTNLGHNSIIFMIECQANYIVRCVERLRNEGLRYLDLSPEAMKAFNVQLQAKLDKTVWARTPRSWYKNAAGKITNNWSGTTTAYWWRTRRPKFTDYREIR